MSLSILPFMWRTVSSLFWLCIKLKKSWTNWENFWLLEDLRYSSGPVMFLKWCPTCLPPLILTVISSGWLFDQASDESQWLGYAVIVPLIPWVISIAQSSTQHQSGQNRGAGMNLSQYPSCHLNREGEGAYRTYLTKAKYAMSYRVTNSHFWGACVLWHIRKS